MTVRCTVVTFNLILKALCTFDILNESVYSNGTLK